MFLVASEPTEKVSNMYNNIYIKFFKSSLFDQGSDGLFHIFTCIRMWGKVCTLVLGAIFTNPNSSHSLAEDGQLHMLLWQAHGQSLSSNHSYAVYSALIEQVKN